MPLLRHTEETPDALRHWVRIPTPQGSALCSPQFPPGVWPSWLERLPALVAAPTARELRPVWLVSNGRKTVCLHGPANLPVVVKWYGAVTSSDAVNLVDQDRPCNATAAFEIQVELWSRGLRVPEPLAYFEQPGSNGVMAQYAVSRLLDRCEPLLQVAFDHLRRRQCPRPRLRRWSRSVLDAVIALHRAGYAHGDLGHHNVLVRLDDPQADLEVFFTDFDACTRSEGAVPREDQLLDLARLAATLYQVVPARALVCALSYYLQQLGVEGERRRQCRAWVVAAHRRVLDQYLACFAQMESRCLAQAENSLWLAGSAP